MKIQSKILSFLMVNMLLLMSTKSACAQWYEINSGVNDNLIDGCFVSDSVGFIIGYNGKVLKTIDAGNSWVENASFNGNYSSISHIGKDTIYIAGTSIYRSTNGGDTWNLVAAPDFWILDIVFFSNHIGFALSPEYDECTWITGTNYFANYKIYKTIDQGLTWQLHSANIESKGRFEQIDETSALIIGGYPVIVAHCAGPWYNDSRKTMDGGENWFGVTQPMYGNSLISFINEDVGYYIQSAAGFYKTIDGGNTLTQLNTSTLPYLADHFKFVDENNGYFITKNKILKTDTSVLDWKMDYFSFDTLNYFFDNGNQYLHCIGKNGKILRKNVDPNIPIDTIIRIDLNPEQLNFGYVQVDSSELKTLMILNNGTSPLNISISSSVDFKIGLTSNTLQTNLNFSLDIYEDTTIYVNFNPIQSIPYSDFMVIEILNISPKTIPLKGSGYYGFSGIISRDTLICTDTLRISGNVTVTEDAKLTICAGTVVNFMDDSQLLIEGELEAIGQLNNEIEFYVNDANLKCNGVIINNITSHQNSAVLDYCNFKSKFYINQLFIRNGIVKVNHSNFSNNGWSPAIQVNKQSANFRTEVYIENSNVFDNSSIGISGGNIDVFSIVNCKIYNNFKGLDLYSENCEIKVFGNFIHHNRDLGMRGHGKLMIQKNKVYNNAGGIELNDCEFKILNNEIYNNKGKMVGGILISQGRPYSYLIQNLIYNNENTLTQTGSNSFMNSNGGGLHFISIYINSPININSNIICNNKTAGLGNNLYAKAAKLNFKNNIFYDVFERDNTVHLSLDSNSVFQYNCSNISNVGNLARGNIYTDPMFKIPSDSVGPMTNIGSCDWSLKRESECINAGDTIGTPLPYFIDFNDKPRVFDIKIDIGAYEFQSYKEPISDSLIVIFPNPTNDFIYVSVNSNLNAEFILYDTSLKKILQKSFNDITRLDLTFISKGIYIYKCILSDGSTKNGKLVKY
jgi:photosystem II stability/assembly factor-like uncharacterized protein